MKTIVAYLFGSAVLVTLLYGGFEAIKQRGRAEVQSAIAVSSAKEIQAAADRAVTTTAILALRVDHDEAAAATAVATLEGMRHEREIAGGGNAVVFDGSFADWLRGQHGARSGGK